MVVASMASMQRFSSDISGMSVAIDNVNMRQSHFESVLRSGGRIAWPKVECGELDTKPVAIVGDNEGWLSGSEHKHTKLAASDLFNNPCLQNGGGD